MAASAQALKLSCPLRPASVSPGAVQATDCRASKQYGRSGRSNGAVTKSIREGSTAVAQVNGNVKYLKWPVNRIPLQSTDIKTSSRLLKIRSCVERTKDILQSMEDGEITISPYDTAWVALLGDSEPQFPSSLQWILKSQLSDGSWGEPGVFSVRDRILNTLACVIALKKWELFPQSIERGLDFIRKYIPKMNDEDDAHTLIGYEIVLPALMEDAKEMGLELPYDTGILQKIYTERALKLNKIPPKILNDFPSTLLHSLEGLREQVKWETLSKLQSNDGSYLFSPASTACAFSKTGDTRNLEYLNSIINKFGGGAPNVYPVDLFERLWSIDRLQRLGISRYFENEILEGLEYVNCHWSSGGIGWARESPVKDLDDTSMAFRLLRLHGFGVKPDAFHQFKEDGEFFCFFGQANQSVTGIFNLYRASQIAFPGETILEDAMNFTRKFLEKRKTEGKLQDKWVISQDLVGEVEYALQYPWFCSQPRIETRIYIDQYGVDDVWIGKTMYRMPKVNNRTYLDLAREDFNFCQSIHQNELAEILRWYNNTGLEYVGLSERDALKSYFLSVGALFEPEMASARLAWTRASILIHGVRVLFSDPSFLASEKLQFTEAFVRADVQAVEGFPLSARTLLTCLLRTVNSLFNHDFLINGSSTTKLRHLWEIWLKEEAQNSGSIVSRDAEVMIVTATWASGEELSGSGHEADLMAITNRVCSLLRRIEAYKNQEDGQEMQTKRKNLKQDAEVAMKQLVKALYERGTRTWASTAGKLCLAVARSCFYAAVCSNQEIARHVDILLFQPVPACACACACACFLS